MKTNNKKKIFIIITLLVLTLVLTGCKGKNDTSPIPNNIKDVKSIMDVIVWPMAKILFFVGKYITAGNYGFALIITTIIIRTIAWPIYAKTNDMSLKMQIMAPEQAKIEAKYEGRTDQASQQSKQMELAQLYRKYGIGIGGCLMPFVQFPIFIAFYSVIRRVVGTKWLTDIFSFKFFGIDLSQGAQILSSTKYDDYGNVIGNIYNKDSKYIIAVIILAVLVGATQVGSQILMSKRQQKTKQETQASLPEYRRPEPTEAQIQSEKMMKYMLYGMTGMMVLFVLQSPAGLGLYWLIGNIYSAFQGYISHKFSGSRMEKLKEKHK